MFSIGEFSQATRLTVKTLRYYHKLGILNPVSVDPETGYRYYDESSFDRAVSIASLKEMGFSLKEIQQILSECKSEDEMLHFVEEKLETLRIELRHLRQTEYRLQAMKNYVKSFEGPGASGNINLPEITEIDFELPWYASVALRGPYALIGKGFRDIYRKAGRYTVGAPLAFYHDMEYQEDNADMEAVVELNREVQFDGIECSSFGPVRAVQSTHKGSYGEQGQVYLRIFRYMNEHNMKPKPPIIERFIKGPGMIFRGNSKNYITNCIVPFV